MAVVASFVFPVFSTLATAQTTSSTTDPEASPPASETWLTGMWNVSSAKVIENDKPRDPQFGHQELLLISGGIKVEIYLPNAEKHKAMKALGSKFKFIASDQESTLYVREQSESDNKKRMGRFTVAATNMEKTTATITYLHRRDNGKEWKYQLNISRIEDAEQLKSIATSILPFLNNTADITVFGQRGLNDGGGMMQAATTDKAHHDLMQQWAKQVLHGSSAGASK